MNQLKNFNTINNNDIGQTLKNFMDWLDRQTTRPKSPLSKTTVRDYRFIYRNVTDYIAANSISDILHFLSKPVIFNFLDSLDVSESRKNHHRAYIANLCKYLDRLGVEVLNPLAGTSVKVEYDPSKYFVPNRFEFQIWLQEVAKVSMVGGISGRDWVRIFKVTAHTGMRHGDLCKFTRFNLSRDPAGGHILTIPLTKEGKARIMLIDDECADDLRYLAANGILPRPYLRSTYIREIATAAARAKLMETDPALNSFPPDRKFRLHDLRRYLVRDWTETLNAPVQMIQQRLGHKNVTTTMRYTENIGQIERERKLFKLASATRKGDITNAQ